MNEKKPVLIFEKRISEKNRKTLEDAGYAVVETSTKFRALGDGEYRLVEGWALDFLGRCSAGGTAKRDFGEWIVTNLANEARALKAKQAEK